MNIRSLAFTLIMALAVSACSDMLDSSTRGSSVVPGAPAAATVIPGNERLTLTWAPVAHAAAYEVWYCDEDDDDSAIQHGGDITGTSHVVASLINGTTYYLWLRAKNTAGTSDFSDAAQGPPTAQVANFSDATTPGEWLIITAGSGSFKISRHNQATITFPFSPTSTTPVDDQKETITISFL